jgi:ferritin-like metal-binding protein YciE
MKLKTLDDLLIHDLKDLYSAESQLIRALPKMAKAASSPSLKQAFTEHLEVTKAQKERLDQVFQTIGASPRGMKCKAMEGLIEEGQDMIQEDGDPTVKDAGLIGSAQKVEHYEIAGYGTVAAMAELLGKTDIAKLLQQTLQEEKQTDELLNKIAMSEINVEAEAK